MRARLVYLLWLLCPGLAWASLPRQAGTFGYTYDAQRSTLPTLLTLPNSAWVTNHYDSLARLDYTALVNPWGHVLDGYGYGYDFLGLRTNIVRDLGLTTSSVSVGYDNTEQLTSWSAKESNGALRQNEQFSYTYDKAGNLRLLGKGNLTETFGCDVLNQITNITDTCTLTVSGATPTPATNVTVNGLTAERYGDFTFACTNLTLTNGQNTFTIIAASTNGLRATNSAIYNLPSAISLAWDSNGNLSNDGTRSFVYDAENRLLSNRVAGAWSAAFVYDGLGRRRIERDYAWQGGAWQLTNELHFIYDSWLLVQERDSNNVVLATYTRGLDLSGTPAGAGGIGGLLARTEGNGSTFYHADGAGNITGLMDGQENMAARYMYSAFGRLTGKWGPMAGVNKMQFSSMPVHPQSGMSLYSLRDGYDPTFQRWIQRDPMGEAGGINLYGFVGNNPIGYVDPLGLSWYEDLFNGVGDKELAAVGAIKEFFLGPPGGVQLKDPDIQRAGSGLIEGLKDANGNDITKETLAEVALQPLLAAIAAPEREGASLFGSAVKCRKASKLAKAAEETAAAAEGGTEIVQRAMSQAELAATESSGLLRGGRSGTHYASDAVNSTAGRAQQRLALPQTPEVRVTLEVPSGRFSPPSRVPPKYDMPGGGMQRTASGDVPVRILRVDEY